MHIGFTLAVAVTAVAGLLAVGRANALHALLYLVVALLAQAPLIYLLGAPFAAAIQAILYAGAIVVLFVFVIMLLNRPGPEADGEGRREARRWLLPALLGAALFVEAALLLAGLALPVAGTVTVKALGADLFGPYRVAVEGASLLLLAGLAAAWHLARGEP